MKNFILLFIMALLSFKLNAFDVVQPTLTPEQVKELKDKTFGLNDPEFKQVEQLVKNYRAGDITTTTSPEYAFLMEQEIQNDVACVHCPSYLQLTAQINKVVEKVGQDPTLAISDELPVKLNKLKFLYYTQALHDKEGKIRCQRMLDYTPDLRPTKFDGQFKLIAEDVLKFDSITEIQYINPELEETVYYYRGEGSDKNIIVQAILTKKGGKFRYYKYTPTEKEENPYNLPDLASTGVAVVEQKIPEAPASKESAPADVSAPAGAAPKELVPENYGVEFKAEVEPLNKYLPKNVHFMTAKMEQDIYGDVKLKGTSNVSLKGNEAHLALKNGTNDLVLIDVNTRLSGRTNHRITVPVSIRVLDSLPKVDAKFESGNKEQVFNMSLTDKNIEYLRTAYRKNRETNKDSFVFARDIPLETNETLSMEYGKGEDDKRYTALRHAKTLKNNVTLVLDVRVDQDRKKTLFYQVEAKF